MRITLKRIFVGENYTIGNIYINDHYFCNSIEDTVRNISSYCPNTIKGINCNCKNKIYGHTAIPYGKYKITMKYSPKFKKVLPYLHDVPHFLGILIHSGNDEKDSAGCIIVGNNTIKGKVLESRKTLEKLIEIIKNEKDITIEIKK